jgi:hypothetical protein
MGLYRFKMTKDEMIRLAIREFQGQVSVGDIVAHQSHRLTHTLVEIEQGIGICELPNGEVNRFPVSELFDANKVKARAVELQRAENTALASELENALDRVEHFKEN